MFSLFVNLSFLLSSFKNNRDSFQFVENGKKALPVYIYMVLKKKVVKFIVNQLNIVISCACKILNL